MTLHSYPPLLQHLSCGPARRFPRTSLILIALTIVSTWYYYFVWLKGGYREDLVWADRVEPGPHRHDPVVAAAAEKSDKKILLVSALFPLPGVKHTPDEYKSWLSHFLGRIETDVYFYTPPGNASRLASALRADLGARRRGPRRLTLNTSFTGPFDVPPLRRWRDRYEEMHAWDRERRLHTPELYAVWNAKPYLLHAAVEALEREEGRVYDYAFWVDAGSFRSKHVYARWPDAARVESVWDDAWRLSERDWEGFHGASDTDGKPGEVWKGEQEGRTGLRGKGDLMFIPSFGIPGYEKNIVGWRKEMGMVDMDFSEGTFFGSTPDTISWYTNTFYKYHDHYISTTPPPTSSGEPTPPFHFVGKDQTLMNAIMFLYPHRFFTVVSPGHQGLLPPDLLSSHEPPSPSSSSSMTLQAPTTPSTLSITPSLSYILSRVFSTFISSVKNKLRGRENSLFGGDWFYFQLWLAGREEREAMCAVWGAASPKDEPSRWALGSSMVGWPTGQRVPYDGATRFEEGGLLTEDEWKEEEIRKLDSGRCRVTRGFPVVRLLEALYGRRWVERVRAWGE